MVLLEGEHSDSYRCCLFIVPNRTGTVKAGSFILAINGDSLSGKSIVQVEEMLEKCGNTVTLKIKKNIKQSSKICYTCHPLFLLLGTPLQNHGQNSQAL